jgi:cobalt-zinc-cadmium efflux system membrane fusion protein
MKLPILLASCTFVAGLLLGSIWSHRAGPPATATPSEQQSSDMVTIDPGSQKAGGLNFVAVRERSLPLTTTAVGSLTLNEQKTDHVGVILPGIVTEVLVRVGDNVKRGQVLGRLHTHELHDAIGAYEMALAEAERTRRLVGYARQSRDRYWNLYEIKFASRQESERAEMDYRNAIADHEKAESMLKATRVHLAEILGLPEDRIDARDLNADTVPIKSPRAGIVTARYVSPGMALQPGSEAFTISDLASLWMAAAVNEEDLRAVRVGLPVKVEVRAYPGQAFDGRIIQLGPQLDPATRTLTARVLVPNADCRLRPEMYATAKIARGASRTALFVPDVSVQDLSGNPVIFVRRGRSEFLAQPVKTGAKIDGNIEIVSGLQADEEVVADGAFVVKSQFLIRALARE